MVSASLLAPSFLRLPKARGSLSRAGNILVVIQLSGGNDGLNMIVPHGDDTYYRLRPTVGLAASTVIRLDEHLGLNAALTPVRDLYEQGEMTIINAVG